MVIDYLLDSLEYGDSIEGVSTCAFSICVCAYIDNSPYTWRCPPYCMLVILGDIQNVMLLFFVLYCRVGSGERQYIKSIECNFGDSICSSISQTML